MDEMDFMDAMDTIDERRAFHVHLVHSVHFVHRSRTFSGLPIFVRLLKLKKSLLFELDHGKLFGFGLHVDGDGTQ